MRAHGYFVVRGDGGFHGYLNRRCPHRRFPLNWLFDRFLDAEGLHIQCANRGALCRAADGYRVAGPCAGGRLTPVRLAARDGQLWLDDIADTG